MNRLLSITSIVLVLIAPQFTTAQRMNLTVNYTASSQCGAGIGFELKGYGIAVVSYRDESYTRADTFFTNNETLVSLSKQIHPSITLSAGAGVRKSDRHFANNEWDSFSTNAIYLAGTSCKVWREVYVNSGILFGKNFLQIYSGISVGIKMND